MNREVCLILGITEKAFFWSALSSICPAFSISVRSQPEPANRSQKTQTKKKMLTRKPVCQNTENIFSIFYKKVVLFLTNEWSSISIYHSIRGRKFKSHLLISFHIYTVTENTWTRKTHFLWSANNIHFNTQLPTTTTADTNTITFELHEDLLGPEAISNKRILMTVGGSLVF